VQFWWENYKPGEPIISSQFSGENMQKVGDANDLLREIPVLLKK
jgi:hypothetical protein